MLLAVPFAEGLLGGIGPRSSIVSADLKRTAGTVQNFPACQPFVAGLSKTLTIRGK